MSKNNQVITISPPMFIGEGNQKESTPAKATGVAIATVTVSFGERNNGNG